MHYLIRAEMEAAICRHLYLRDQGDHNEHILDYYMERQREQDKTQPQSCGDNTLCGPAPAVAQAERGVVP
jgi:hypothetical protein